MKNASLTCFALALTALTLGGAACRSFDPGSLILFPGILESGPSKAEAAALYEELGGEAAFLDLSRYLYRWYFDENDYARLDPQLKDQLWLRRLEMIADEGDRSRYLEVVLPAVGVAVTLKKTDYRIPELKLDIRSGGYRVIRVSRDAVSPKGFAVLKLHSDALIAKIFEMRLERTFPGDALQTHILTNLSPQADALAQSPRNVPQTFFFAPVHEVDNEAWVFWEEGKLLFKASSEIDLANPDAWRTERLELTVIDTVCQTVVSFSERPGSNRHVTRDQVGRALYNCVVLGQKRTALPAASP